MKPERISEVVAELRARLNLPVNPAQRGPIHLDRFYSEMSGPRLSHHTIPDLTRGKVLDHLRGQGIPVLDGGDADERLAGFIFKAGRVAWVYVSCDKDNPVGRQRFTAAHELGHAVLHYDAMPEQFLADTHEMIADDGDKLAPKEREANRFAAELLMPAEVCRARAEELQGEYGCCPRSVLIYRLASELLVSREALRYRLNNLGVGHE